jgi:hypothetical protein
VGLEGGDRLDVLRCPGERAIVDSAMFYLTGTFYPLVARATYPTLGFPQYAGEVAPIRVWA